MKKAALLSVSNREGLPSFAKNLKELGYILLGTKGTKKYLEDFDIDVESIEEYTGQNEILDGRVKTLHPRIHAGLLARRDNPEHMQELETNNIYRIDVAAVNLYPFIQGLSSDKSRSLNEMVELIDIGGPTMIRAAAKNFDSIYAVIDPQDYDSVLEALSIKDETTQFALRKKLACKVFTELANYNLNIASFLSAESASTSASELPDITGMVLCKKQSLRYGENPHQNAAFYEVLGDSTNNTWQQLQGKELSYNNLLDFDAALKIINSLDIQKPAVAIVKHLNPCGAAVADKLIQALAMAKQADPRSHFGGIVACNQKIESDFAQAVTADFAEIIVAPDFSEAAMTVFASKKNLRIIKYLTNDKPKLEVRSIISGVLLQTPDSGSSKVEFAKVVSEQQPQPEQYRDLQLAWTLCAHIKSNAVNLVKNNMMLASGAGQMSRIDSVELALSKAQTHDHDLKGAVCASDAFFPFPDSIEKLAKAGISAVIAPGGSLKDKDIIAAANQFGIALLFAEDRHFKH